MLNANGFGKPAFTGCKGFDKGNNKSDFPRAVLYCRFGVLGLGHLYTFKIASRYIMPRFANGSRYSK